MNRAPADINLRYALRALRRRLPLFLLCLVIVPAVAAGYSVLQKKQYTATASLYFRDPQFDQKLFSSSFVGTQPDPTRQAATNLDLVSLPKVAALTAARLHGITEDKVTSSVSESSVGQSDLVSIQAVAGSPEFAARLANTFASQYILFRRNADRATIVSAELPLERQIASLTARQRNGALGQSLQSRLSQLRVLASLQTGGAELVQRAEVPRGPSAPKTARNVALGVFFGLLLGIGLVLLAEALDRRLRDPDEVEQIFERPILATVPESEALTGVHAALLDGPRIDGEAFRMLWTTLRYFTLRRDIRAVLVTSADRDDGKSTVAWGLAAAAATAGKRVLMVEADLRNPTFARRFDVSAPIGLTDVLLGDVGLADAIMRYRFPTHDNDPRAGQSIDVLFAGSRPPNPSDVLQSQRMADMAAQARGSYDLVVFDTPPAAIVSDAIPLITLVDGVIVVSRLGKTLRDHAHRLRRQLDHLDAPVLGVVINSVAKNEPYGYGYGYGYAEDVPVARSNGTARRERAKAPSDQSTKETAVATAVGQATTDHGAGAAPANGVHRGEIGAGWERSSEPDTGE